MSVAILVDPGHRSTGEPSWRQHAIGRQWRCRIDVEMAGQKRSSGSSRARPAGGSFPPCSSLGQQRQGHLRRRGEDPNRSLSKKQLKPACDRKASASPSGWEHLHSRHRSAWLAGSLAPIPFKCSPLAALQIELGRNRTARPLRPPAAPHRPSRFLAATAPSEPGLMCHFPT